MFFCKFYEILQISFLWNTSGGCFWNIYRGTPVIPYNQLYWNPKFALVFFWKFDSYSKDTFFWRAPLGHILFHKVFFTVPLDVPTFRLFDSFFQFFCCTCFLGNLSFFSCDFFLFWCTLRLWSEFDISEIFWLSLAAIKVSSWKFNSRPNGNGSSSTDATRSSLACCFIFSQVWHHFLIQIQWN